MIHLSDKEKKVIKAHLESNGCGANTATQLLGDNFSCVCFEDFTNKLPDMSKSQIAGVISTLERKTVIAIERRTKKNGGDIYWVESSFLEMLPKRTHFKNLFNEAA